MTIRSALALLLVLGCPFTAETTHAQSASLPLEAKQRILRTGAEALKDGNITATQHADLVHWTSIEPCRKVQMKVAKAREIAVARVISEVQGFPNSKVLGYFEAQGWYIVFTDASPGDEQYLVYDRDPLSRIKPRASWGGAATMFETNEIFTWLLSSAPGVPKRLAECFAWRVTLGQ